jgi:hypothetical protein
VNNTLSPAGMMLLDDEGIPNETEEQRRKRLAAIEAQKKRANAALSPAGQTLAARSYGLGGAMLSPCGCIFGWGFLDRQSAALARGKNNCNAGAAIAPRPP